MNISSLAKGLAVGMAVGAVTYAVTNASRMQKRRMKMQTIRAVKSVSNALEGLGSMFA